MRIPYLVTGSMATIADGEPGFTNGIDVVVAPRLDQVDAFRASFPEPDSYCYRQSTVQAVEQRFQFNIIHFESRLRIDAIIPDDSEFNRSRMARAVRLPGSPDFEVWFALLEDVIVKKLEYYRNFGIRRPRSRS